MELTIKYFGMIKEAVGKGEETINYPAALTVSDLNKALISSYPLIKDKSYQIAVNQEIKNEDQLISDDSEIALLPQFAGG